MAKKIKNFLNKKIEIKDDDNYNGIVFGLMIGSAVGMILSMICEIEFGFLYGTVGGMLIGVIIDSCIMESKKSKKKVTKRK